MSLLSPTLGRTARILLATAAALTLGACRRSVNSIPTPRDLTQAEELQRSLVRNGADRRVAAELVETTSAIRAARDAITYRASDQYIGDLAQIALRAAQTAEVRDQAVLARRAADSLAVARLQRLVGSTEQRHADLLKRIDSLTQANTALQEQLRAAVTQLRSLSADMASLRSPAPPPAAPAPAPTSYTLGDALFAAGKGTLTPAGVTRVRQIAIGLRGRTVQRIAIDGHMDAGPTAQQLSEQRANAVRSALERAGVQATLLTARGLGATQPAEQGTTAAARRANRRVEIIVQQ